MCRMSNLNKFKDSYQVFEKNPRLCFIRKRNSKTYKECLNNFFGPKILTVNTLSVNVIVMTFLVRECYGSPKKHENSLKLVKIRKNSLKFIKIH
jgi:hypothetical protein